MNIDVKENFLMNSLRKMDKLGHSLSTLQANIFEKSVEKGLPSFFFIKSFMVSDLARDLDELNLESAGLTEIEIFDVVKSNIKIKRGKLVSYPIMRFLGYFYRSASYLYKLSSKFLYKNIPPKILIESYDSLHALPIEEAIKDVFDILKINIESNEEIFIKLYKTNN